MSSNTCGCKWVVSFKWIHRDKTKISDKVAIQFACSFHSTTCDPIFGDQFVVVQIHSRQYEKGIDQVLKMIMVQMSIDRFANIKLMTELLQHSYLGENILIGI